MTKAAATLDATPVVDRVRAAIAACPDGVRPATIEHALGLQGELRAVTEGLEAAGEVVFERGRLQVSPDDAASTASTKAYRALSKPAATELHARLAEAIGRTSYEPGIAEFEQACHELRAGRRDEGRGRLARVAHEATRAADHALVVRAIDELAASGATLDARVQEQQARAALEAGDPRAAELWHRAVAAWDAADDPDRATRAAVSWFWSSPDDPAAAARLTEEATGDGSGGWGRYAAAVRSIFDADWQAAIEPLEAALAQARDAGDRELEAAVLGSLATARSYMGQLDLAIELLRRSAPLAAANSDAVTIRRIRHNLVETLVEALRTAEAVDEARHFAGDLQRLGARNYLPGALALEARVRALAGDVNEARALASRALAGDRELDEPQRDVYVHMVAAELLAMGGDTDRFRGFVADVRDRCRDFGFDSYDAALDEVRARALLVTGEPGALAKLLDASTDTEPTGLATLALAAGRLRLETGDDRLAAAHDAMLARIGALGELATSIPLVALALREGRAIIEADAGELEAVAAEWETAGRPVDAAMLRRASPATMADTVAIARIDAQLESHGWSALAARPVGDATDDEGDAAAVPIASLPLLSNLPAAERARVLATMVTHELHPTAGVDGSDPVPAGVSIVVRGEVRLLRAEPGSTERRLVVAALGPGDVFGHESMLPEHRAGALVEAAVPSLLHVVPADELPTLTSHAPSFAAALLTDAGERLGEARLLAGESALLPVETRLARTLVRLGERFGRPSLRGELLLDTSLTHADIASMIGSQRARVSSLLSALHKAGVTDAWKRRIVVLDSGELRRRAGLPPTTP